MANGSVYLLVSITAFFWGANFVLGGFVLEDMPPLWAAAIRFALAVLLMLIIVSFRREPVFAPLRQHASTYAMLGVVGIVAFNLLFFYALTETSANNAALIMATNPLLTTMIAAMVLGERPGMRHFVALPVALIGVTVVITHGRLDDLLALHFSAGDVLMLAANIFWALYNVLCRRYMPQASPWVNITWIMAAGTAVLLLVALASGESFVLPGSTAGWSVAVMAIGGTVLAYLFWNAGIAKLGAARTSIFLNLVPVFAMLLGAIVAASPTAAQLAGGLLVLVGVSIAMSPPRKLLPA